MKKSIKLFIVVLLLAAFNIKAQANLPLKHNKEYYKNKKVIDLINDLKIDIKAASFYGGWSEEMNRISLRFNDKDTKIIIFIKDHDAETNKLFLNTDPNTSKKIDRNYNKNMSNSGMLSKYLNLTILYIN
ncbi:MULTISPECIES: hypothetical protein [Chryseobacterium]|uniref:DUF4252 domain-containing protein n=1 Tax=Chryseobacterium camelliae TaxID=1265445 RepID=A0ABU0TE69_9FLAO|nr:MULTISPECIES: hypothetical protein [Chryseobacterium]MDT3406841.1 hypothetical protein [Pseudacidovorax intermedius]MDQ1095363.1 hypothetical protein [Chryseobacterium camelliae]MDQ1099301.1 hypothetical protein [Chryseobacterium sp. SORGH_AS_1048]MDR6086650.1 hypothetical protein [Chryseobacterium sp. SORGH_AS_0909]MDR6131022.1 hypothetical protein [Chryseobacterium sp. SORGH_AS_1175]